jgi:hypothetical protein
MAVACSGSPDKHFRMSRPLRRTLLGQIGNDRMPCGLSVEFDRIISTTDYSLSHHVKFHQQNPRVQSLAERYVRAYAI